MHFAESHLHHLVNGYLITSALELTGLQMVELFAARFRQDKGQPHYTPSHRWCGPRTTGYHRRRGAA
jgi:hypothetical protein